MDLVGGTVLYLYHNIMVLLFFVPVDAHSRVGCVVVVGRTFTIDRPFCPLCNFECVVCAVDEIFSRQECSTVVLIHFE